MADLADEIRHNPTAGARRLVAEYRDRLYQVAYRLCLNAADAEDLTFRTFQRAIVGSYAPNTWGLYDTAGNVWEWCLDWYADDITGIGGKVNIDPATPANTLSGNPASGAKRVIRGGSWNNAASFSRPAFRVYYTPADQGNNLGFRVVCTGGLQ